MLRTSLLLSLDLRNNGLNLGQVQALFRSSAPYHVVQLGTHRDFAVTLHNTDFDVLRTSLDDLEQTLYGKFDGVLAIQVIFMVLLQELPYGLRRTADGVGLPLAVDTSGLCLVQLRLGVMWVEADDEGCNSKRPNTSGLRVFLSRGE